MDRVQIKIEASKKLGINLSRQQTNLAVKQDLSELFQDSEVIKSIDCVQDLSNESCMRKVNAKRASVAFKKFVSENGILKFDKPTFVDFGISIMKKYDFCDTKAEEDQLRLGFDNVFKMFDYDSSGFLDNEEIANCLALMCGGSINEKIYAAFNMFDSNNSMTLSFDELHKFIKCVFQIFEKIKNQSANSLWGQVDFNKLTLATTEKCFNDNHVIKGKGEINYT